MELNLPKREVLLVNGTDGFHEFTRVVQRNPWRIAGLAGFIAAAICLVLHGVQAMVLPELALLGLWLGFLSGAAATLCVPSHRLVWAKMAMPNNDEEWTREWFENAKSAEVLTLPHEGIRDIVASSWDAPLDLLHDIAEYEHTPSEVIGYMATSPGYFTFCVELRALTHPGLPEQAIREVFDGLPDERNTWRALVMLEERKQLLPLPEMLRLTRRHPSVDVRNAAKRRYYGDLAAFEPNPDPIVV